MASERAVPLGSRSALPAEEGGNTQYPLSPARGLARQCSVWETASSAGELQVRHSLLKKAPVKVRGSKSSMGKAWAGGSFLTEVHPFRQSKRLTLSPRLGRTWEKRRA